MYRDPDVVRGDENNLDDPIIAQKSQTASKMLNIFKQMEEQTNKRQEYDGLKPLKRFTPPPDEGKQRVYHNDSDSEHSGSESGSDEEDDDEESENEIEERPIDKYDEDYLKQIQSAERAKQLKAKFERWETNEIKREQNNSSVNLYEGNEDAQSQIESTRR